MGKRCVLELQRDMEKLIICFRTRQAADTAKDEGSSGQEEGHQAHVPYFEIENYEAIEIPAHM
jgi:hypothetical protein